MAPQDDILGFLLGQATGSDLIQTHSALVVLAGDMAYKIKRPVRYDYLDYTTLERRHAALARELELNAPAAPTIYRDLVPVTRGANGGLAFGGPGETVDWVLRMNRFPDADQLDRVAARGALDRALAESLGERIARYHARAPARRNTGGAVLIGNILGELRREFAGMTEALPDAETTRWLDRARAALTAMSGLLDRRAEAGQVRRCHGDLHLRNIVLIDGVPVPFDALEFSEELGTCDVLYDLAFLLMDLRHRGLKEAATHVLNRYLHEAGTDDLYAGLAALPLFLSVRAAIGAMVTVQAARAQGRTEVPDEALRYLRDALAALEPVPARLVAVGGLSGTGKTTLARALAPECGRTPGAVHLRSDLVRKALCGVAPLTRLTPEAYTPEMSARVYQRLCDLAGSVLAAGQAVIVDAVYLRAAERDAIAGVAGLAGVRFDGIWLEAGAEVLAERVTARTGDASDADASVVAWQLGLDPGAIGWHRVAASGSPEQVLDAARAALGMAGDA